MKILKYGEGYFKTCTCENCKSELEYEMSDVYCGYRHRFADDNTYDVEEHKFITCPVCNHTINLEILLVQSSVPVEPKVEPKRKKRWWQR